MKTRLLLLSTLLFSGSIFAAGTVDVNITPEKFDPMVVKVKAGTTVRWVNKDEKASHSVYFEEEGMPESDTLVNSESWQRSFDKAGFYPYVNGKHPEINGVVEVSD